MKRATNLEMKEAVLAFLDRSENKKEISKRDDRDLLINFEHRISVHKSNDCQWGQPVESGYLNFECRCTEHNEHHKYCNYGQPDGADDFLNECSCDDWEE